MEVMQRYSMVLMGDMTDKVQSTRNILSQKANFLYHQCINLKLQLNKPNRVNRDPQFKQASIPPLPLPLPHTPPHVNTIMVL